MAISLTLQPQLLRWARERASLEPVELARKVQLQPRRVAEWEETGRITLTHLERLAEKTYTPIGYLFLAEPPVERLPIADYRAAAQRRTVKPSPDLLDTLHQCQQRQQWYREYLQALGEPPLAFVGSATTDDTPVEVATRIRALLELDEAERAEFSTWSEALRALYERVESIGVLVMRNGIVGNNTHRKLSVAEFRGFTLSDNLAPLIFVNGADAKAAQMFTVAHELAHVWLGASGITDAAPQSPVRIERFCNRVAAELLVPSPAFEREWREGEDLAAAVSRLARYFKVSTLVVLIRAREAGKLTDLQFQKAYAQEADRSTNARESAGGDFYRTQRARLGLRFAQAVVASALEGRTTYTVAFRLLGVRKSATFDELGRQLGYKP